MKSLRIISVVASVVAFGLGGCAQTPVDHAAHHPDTAAPTVADAMPMGGSMAQMDEHMKAMREMHEKMKRAKTPEEKNALMVEHMKLMQDGMAMMGGVSPGAMGGMDNMKDKVSMSGDMAMHGQMMEKRMEMMQSMMQMMMDRMPQPAAKP